MRFVEIDHVICFNESHGLFGTRLRYAVAPCCMDNCQAVLTEICQDYIDRQSYRNRGDRMLVQDTDGCFGRIEYKISFYKFFTLILII